MWNISKTNLTHLKQPFLQPIPSRIIFEQGFLGGAWIDSCFVLLFNDNIHWVFNGFQSIDKNTENIDRFLRKEWNLFQSRWKLMINFYVYYNIEANFVLIGQEQYYNDNLLFLFNKKNFENIIYEIVFNIFEYSLYLWVKLLFFLQELNWIILWVDSVYKNILLNCSFETLFV